MFLVVLAAGAMENPARATPHVRVRGSARIDAHVATTGGGRLRLEGTLTDDANVPLEGESVSVSLNATAPRPVAFDLESCTRAKASEVAGESARGIVFARTDEGGRFCVTTKVAVQERCVAHFAWDGTLLLEGATQAFAVDPSLSSIELRFDPEPSLISLEREPFGLDAVASFTDKAAASSPRGLGLALTNELGTRLGLGTTDTSGRVRFTLVPAKAGPPGKGELRVVFDGNASTGRALHVAQVERHARVSLSAPSAKGGTLPPGTPEEGVSVIVLAQVTSGERVPSGSVEARIKGNPVGAAAIENGRANLVITSAAEEGAVSEIQLRYTGDAPWYEAGDDVVLRLPVVPRSPWRAVPLAVAGLAVVVWLSLGRTALRSSLRLVPAPRRQASTSVQAKVTVVRAARDARVGWTGHVIDAHDTTAVSGAEIAILRPGFERSAPLARTTTYETGRFELRCDGLKEGDLLAVSSRLHATLRQRVPPCGEIEIALVLRRRALLDRLVAWARERGAPFDITPEPTPAEVAHAAIGDPRTARWAKKVEHAVFGPGEVDGRVETDVDEEAPPPAAGSSERLEKDIDDTPR